MKNTTTSKTLLRECKRSFDGGVHELPLARTGLLPSLPLSNAKPVLFYLTALMHDLISFPKLGRGSLLDSSSN